MALDLGTVISGIYTGIIATLNARTGVLITDGQDLAAVLLFITVSWAVVMWLLSGDGSQALMDSFSALTRFGIVSVMLVGWLGTVGGFLQGNVNDISGKVAGTSSISQSVDLMVKAASKLFASADAAKKEVCKEVEVADPATGTISNSFQCGNVSARGAEVTFMDILIHFPMVLLALLLKFLALGFMMLMLAAYITVVFMAEVLFGIGMALGPILVPWLIWQRTEWLFDGWLRFTLAACFTKIVAALMVAVVSSIIVAARTLSDEVNVSSGLELLAVDEMAAFLMCACAAVGTFMMWQVTGIAQGLLSGSGGATARGFGGGSIGKMISSGAKGAGSAPGLQNDMKAARAALAKSAEAARAANAEAARAAKGGK